MKIAVFYNLPFSGAKRTVQEHVKGLARLGHSVDVYTTDQVVDIFRPGLFASQEFKYRYNKFVMPLPFLRKLSSDLNDFFLLKIIHKNIASDIDKRSYDVVLVHTDILTQAPFVLRYLKTKKVYFCLEPLKMGHEYSFKINNLPMPNLVYENINRIIRTGIDIKNARCADDTIAISKFGRELMISSFDLYPKISYLGVDTKLFQKKNYKRKNQVLFVGQKLRMNGYQYINGVLSQIPVEIRPKIKVVSIKRKGRRLTDAEMVKHYSESIVTLSLSNFDTFGLVPLESMACKTPVIAFDVAGYRETIIHNKTGFLVEFDSSKIAEKIMYFLKNKEQIEKMGENGRNWVNKNWNWEHQINILEKQLLDLVNR